MSINTIITNAITTVLLLGAATTATAATDTHAPASSSAAMQMGPSEGMEKCYGIAKAGMNDCGTENHNCSGESKVDGDKTSWLSVPTGLCKRIAGGNLVPAKKV